MKKNKKGFTLVELVIVVAVMAVLIAVAIPTVTSITQTAKTTVAQTNARTIESTLKLKEAELNKEGGTILTLDAQMVFDAIYDAKLGLTEGEYIYNTEKGVVTAIVIGSNGNPDNAAADGEYLITFGDSGLTQVVLRETVNGALADSATDVATTRSAVGNGENNG
jgi:prepilin-type N-terminal cleavage/methylation domain-containing protein